MLIDSNIIIYAAQPAHQQLRKLIADNSIFVSAISYVEVLGYHMLNDYQKTDLETFFQIAQVLPLSQPVLEQAVMLRQQRKISFGDALIAGTSLVYNLTLVTNNSEDFQWIDHLKILNPIKTQ